MKKFTIVMIVLDILVVLGFVVTYCIPFVKNTVIMTSLNTKTHQYIAYTFYSEETINKVLAGDSFTPLTDSVNLNEIVIDNAEREHYDSEYEKAILTRDQGNEDYKLLNIDVAGYKAYLVAIYDPSKVQLIHSKTFNQGTGQEQIKNMCLRYGGTVCINGGMFVDNGLGSDIPMGYLIKNGKIIWSDNEAPANLIGFTKDHKLLLTNSTGEEAIKMGMRDALEFGPFLIVNGKSIEFNSAVGGYSRAARVAIAQRRDGTVLFLVTEGTHAFGPNMGEVIQTLKNYGAYNAANLDGGTSSQLAINGQLINTPKNIYGQVVYGGRAVVSGFGLVP
ncbi:MAG: phosphodiester glycosidase family protein [Bacilli bacterium]